MKKAYDTDKEAIEASRILNASQHQITKAVA